MLHGYDENYDSRGKASHFTFHGKRKDGQQVVKIPFTNLIRQLIKTVFLGFRYFRLSAATLKSVDSAGLGMVRDGTKCGNDKVSHTSGIWLIRIETRGAVLFQYLDAQVK